MFDFVFRGARDYLIITVMVTLVAWQLPADTDVRPWLIEDEDEDYDDNAVNCDIDDGWCMV